MAKKRKTKKQSTQQRRAERIRDLVLSGIGVECKAFGEVVDDLKSYLVRKDTLGVAEYAIPCIRKQAREQLVFIRQAIEDLGTLDAGGSRIPAGKR